MSDDIRAAVSGRTRLCCLLGSPVAHSISPMMHNLAFQTLGLDLVYLCFECGQETLPVMVPALREMNVLGFNLTMPLKTAVIPYLDRLSVEAELIGAVNTVKNENGILTGYNTDGTGFLKAAAEEGCSVEGEEIVILGAGGAASAIAVQAALDGARKIHLVCRRSRSWQHAQALADKISLRTGCGADLTDIADAAAFKKAAENASLLINGTSAGMAPDIDCTPVPDLRVLPSGITVADVIYHPARTRLLQEAANAGHRTFNGMYMLLYQGEKAFEIWTGQKMPVELVKERYFRP